MYRYNTETRLYYLNSRYYTPELGRFINADAIVGQPGELLGHNMFAYSKNNPINMSDSNGFRPVYANDIDGEDDNARDASYKVMNKPRPQVRADNAKKHNFNNLKICTDGPGGSLKEDPDYQEGTYLEIGGLSINARNVHYIVLPGDYNGPAKYGDIGIILDLNTKNFVFAIIGDLGPNGASFGEVSIKSAWDLGYSNATARSGPSDNFQFILFPGTKQNWRMEGLQDQINAVGETVYR